MKNTLTVLLLTAAPTATFAWGGRGHHSICSAAVHLVEDKNLREFLQWRPHVMGHLCNVPDIYWKSLARDKTRGGDFAHFIDPEVGGYKKMRDVPLNLAEIEKALTGQPNRYKPALTIRSVAEEFGSLWWRVDQFFRRIVTRKDAFAAAAPPERKREQDDKLPYNAEVFDMMTNMGLMGHFVGDASQPLHSTADYDGYDAGHGGLHSYYEEMSVAFAEADLEGQIVAQARKIKTAPWLSDKSTTLEKMRDFSAISHDEIAKVLKLDPIKKPSTVRNENGLQLKDAAVREDAAVGWKKFKPMIVSEMARSARLLAHLWDRSYAELGKPDLKLYRSFRYPFTPDFVPVDYATLPAPKEDAKAK